MSGVKSDPINQFTQWSRLSSVTAAVVVVVLVWLWLRLDQGPIRPFIGGTVIGVVLVSALCWRTMTLARREAGPERITLATWITASRGSALIVLTGFLFSGTPAGLDPLAWVPGLLFAIAAGLDAIDGVIARATGSVSELGGRLDVEMDALTVLLGSILVVRYGVAPTAFLAVGVARYAFVAGIRYRQWTGRPVYDLDPSTPRRVLGGLAMVAIWLALLPLPGQTISRMVATVVLVPFLLNFGRDWLVVSGRHPVSRRGNR